MRIRIVTEPSVEPITTAQAKTHLRIDHSNHDTLIDTLIKAARQRVESTLGRALVQQTRAVSFQNWPVNDEFEIPYPPIQSVMHLKYTDSGGNVSTFSSPNYGVDTYSEPGRLVLGYSKSWPTATLHHPNYPIEITYVCGYEPTNDSPADYRANIPEPVIQGMKILIAHLYENPQPVIAGVSVAEVPISVDALLAPYKVWRF